MNGYELCKRLKEDPSTKEIPILFLSSLLESSQKIKGLESGAVDFINTTSDYAEILARIQTHLKIRELGEELRKSNRELLLKQKILHDDLKAAAMIQSSLMPMRELAIPQLDIAWICDPCEYVGGDICNVYQMNVAQSAYYVLDVSGHGVPSAMITVSIMQFLQQKRAIDGNLSPKQALDSLNKEFPFESFNNFFTIFYVILNTRENSLTYASAGHPPAVLLKENQSYELLTTECPLIGIFPDYAYKEKTISIDQGDKLVIYSDGVIEYCNEKGELFGSPNFYSLLENNKKNSIQDLARIVSESLKKFGNGSNPRDDVSLLGIEMRINKEKKF